jgi:hypothetical protein
MTRAKMRAVEQHEFIALAFVRNMGMQFIAARFQLSRQDKVKRPGCPKATRGVR